MTELKCVYFFLSSPEDIFSFLFWKRDKGRERNTDAREKHRLVASLRCQDQGSVLALQGGMNPGITWIRIKPATSRLWADAATG